MKKIDRLIREIKREQNRTDKLLREITFEIRDKQVIMFFNYEETIDNIHDNPHAVKHNHDPEFLNLKELDMLKPKLSEIGLPFTERRDDFM
ncbi:hypothetical protein N9R04_02745 [Staphylococcus sp. SQ8-PEA]|uniref:Uncharacterized protein n=1 Tax=Staphylococcus marylandisciuri TaxID=2981529 RepID=A0ABT2QNW2_9STAP|nr:hypothetical protein [Staphylococcus marylandisciuri]MCU5745640.1 hypothetical protein [Staphylococcus marylandisciuri]